MKLYLLFLPLALAIFFNVEPVKDSNQLKFQSGPSPKFLEQMKRDLPRLRLQTKQAFEESLIVSDYAEKHTEIRCVSVRHSIASVWQERQLLTTSWLVHILRGPLIG